MEANAVLRGELFKASESGAAYNYKLRWFELNTDGTLQWADAEGSPPKNALSLQEAMIVLEPIPKPESGNKKEVEPRFGIRITPASGSKGLCLRCSSEEERKVWVESMDAVSHSVAAYNFGSAHGRTVRLPIPASASESIGVDLGADQESACVTVCGLGPAAAQSGLLVGDVIVAVDATVLRTLPIAERAFTRARRGSTVILRLAGWNREVRLVKQAGLSGLTLCTPEALPNSSPSPSSGKAVVIGSVAHDSPAQLAGLHPGDRILSVNGARCAQGHAAATAAIRASLQEVRLVVSGHTVAVDLRKDADGRLGLGFTHGQHVRGTQLGALITDVMPRSAAHQAGLRNGDLLVSVDGNLVNNQRGGLHSLSTAARALTCVVWRAKPDEAGSESIAGGSGLDGKGSQSAAVGGGTDSGGGSGSGGGAAGAGGSGDGGAASGEASRDATTPAPLTVGTVPYAYYAHAMLPTGNVAASLPSDVSLYEDLTAT